MYSKAEMKAFDLGVKTVKEWRKTQKKFGQRVKNFISTTDFRTEAEDKAYHAGVAFAWPELSPPMKIEVSYNPASEKEN